MEAAPSPDHGFSVYLGARRSIEVDVSFDSALLGSTAAVADEVAGYAPGGQASKSREKLGNRTAQRVGQSWPAVDRRRVIVCRWDDTGGSGNAINFVITLETTAAAYDQDKGRLDDMLTSFRYVPRNP